MRNDKGLYSRVRTSQSEYACLVLEDGSIFEGKAVGQSGQTFGEIVFNTSATGYQEILTDPSYKFQIVLMTYPEIGNYGINSDDFESKTIQAAGFVVSRLSPFTSSWRAEFSLIEFLNKNNIIAIQGVDTRALTVLIRNKGAMKAGIFAGNQFASLSQRGKLLESVRLQPDIKAMSPVTAVTVKAPYAFTRKDSKKQLKTLVVIDLGVKSSIIYYLAEFAETVIILPALSSLEMILSYTPQGVLFSNGPGDPAVLTETITLAQKLIEKTVPIFGICLGHQILGLACGAKMSKMQFGHHGGNHPVKEVSTGRVFITSQNHGYHADFDTFPENLLEITHINLNDGSIEGFKHKNAPVMSVQFHPEASPGPQDANEIFEMFIQVCNFR
ncbi:MAG: glutamine-hydrolyzing carbamoyl-phosphate synthase small subunit [Cyanobacteria bacterium P01_H01_bin.74]